MATAPDLMGHNSGIRDLAAEAVADLNDSLAQRDGFDARCKALVAASDRAVAVDAETAGKCADLIKMIKTATTVIDGARVSVKAPYLAATRAIDDTARVLTTPLEEAERKVRGKVDVFTREERARQDAERRRQEEAARAAEAERREREAQAAAAGEPVPEPEPAAAAPAPVAEPATIRGDYGAQINAKTVWKHEVTDWTAAFAAVADNAKVREAIDKVIAAQVKAGTRSIPGVRIFDDVAVAIR